MLGARAVLDVLVLDLALVVVVVWEEYQGKRLACPLLQRPGGAAPSETQSEAIRGHQEAIKRPSRGHQEAINETHLLEKELLGGRDGALRLEIAARLMREAIRGVIRGVIRGNLRQSEAIGGNPRQSGRRAEIAARLGVQFYLQTLLQRGARGGDCGLWQKRVGRAP